MFQSFVHFLKTSFTPKKSSLMHKGALVVITTLSLVGYGALVFASPNIPGGPISGSGGFTAGTELDPDCAPNQVVPEPCLVKVPPGESTTANNGLTLTGTNVQLGGTLIQNTTINQAGHDFLVKDGNYFFGKVSDATTIAPFLGTDPLIGNGYIDSLTGDMYLNSYINTSDGQYLLLVSKNAVTNGMTINGSNRGFDIFSEQSNNLSKLHIGSQNAFLINNNTATGISNSIYLSDIIGIQFSTELGSYTFPRTDGTANQVLTTNGAGQLSWQNAARGRSGWSLTGNAGTTAGTNFIGTTDAQDFMVKTNGNQIAWFGQNGGIAIGSDDGVLGISASIGINSFAGGQGTSAIGARSVSFGSNTSALGDDSVVFGINSQAQGRAAAAFGTSAAIADYSAAFGYGTRASSYGESSFGTTSTFYIPVSTTSWFQTDRLFSIGNGTGSGGPNHNAFTLWKDGSFAYNDDNFQNDTPGTEQNMFYFNYGNHDGLGAAQTKRAIRLGSAINNEWDINSANVGDRSVVIGFSSPGFGLPAPNASGDNATAFGVGTFASGAASLSLGMSTLAQGPVSVSMGLETMSSGDHSFAWGYLTRAVADGSTAWGQFNSAEGRDSTSWGIENKAFSAWETSFGIRGTPYIPASITGNFPGDRLVNIGNGNSVGSSSDALTILKNGQTGIAIDNFETNTNGNIFQVGDGTTNVIGYVDGAGNWQVVSDERKKHNIIDIQYGLNEILKLRPVSFDYNRNNEHTIGFLAQQVLPIIPESVGGSDEKGYSMAYQTLVPVTVKAIQELNLKLSSIESVSDTLNPTFIQNMRNWLGDSANGISTLVAHVFKSHRVETEELCVGTVCVTQDQFLQMVQQSGVTPQSNNSSEPNSSSLGNSSENVTPSSSSQNGSSQDTPVISQENSSEVTPQETPSEATSPETTPSQNLETITQ